MAMDCSKAIIYKSDEKHEGMCEPQKEGTTDGSVGNRVKDGCAAHVTAEYLA